MTSNFVELERLEKRRKGLVIISRIIVVICKETNGARTMNRSRGDVLGNLSREMDFPIDY